MIHNARRVVGRFIDAEDVAVITLGILSVSAAIVGIAAVVGLAIRVFGLAMG